MMNEEYIKRLDFDSDTFEAMKTDMNFILQRMIGSMIEKDSTEGSMTIKIDVNMVTEWIPNNNPDVEGETRMIRKPQFKHKCASTIKINDEKSGSFNNEMELDMNENGCYYLKPVADTTQRTIFDSDFQSGMNKPEPDKEDDSGIIDGTFKELPGDSTPALPCNDDSGNKDESDTPAEGKPEDSTENAPDSPETDENGTDNISPQTRITTLKSTLPKPCSALTEIIKRVRTSRATITVMMNQRRSSQCLECQVT